jgi:RHS repeat-associated protein
MFEDVMMKKSIFVGVLSSLLAAPLHAATATQATTSYTYYADGQIKTEDGPRTDVQDVTTYTYHSDTGFLKTVTNAMGHVTTYETYNASGQATKIINPDGVITELEYHPRGWVTKVLVHIGDINFARVTEYDYDAVGQVTRMQLPTGAELQYEYDDARRLTAIQNGLGERMEYTLDAAGNPIAEVIKDAGGSIVYSVERAYDELSRVMDIFGNNGQNDNFEYDADDNLVKTYDARNNITTFHYDNLNRLKETLEANSASTALTYDASDNLATVKDARNLTTTYTTNALGHQTQLQSPDTGTSSFEYDAAGNMTRKVDARNIVSTYTYNALNQLTAINYPSQAAENVTYSYYTTSDPKEWRKLGEVKQIRFGEFQYDFTYWPTGEMAVKRLSTQQGSKTLWNQWYWYDAKGHLSSVRRAYNQTGTDERNWIYYDTDAQGRVSRIYINYPNGSGLPDQDLVRNVQYSPFGPVNYYEYGNGLSHTLEYDTDFNIQSIRVGGIDPILEYVYDFNDLNLIVGIQDGLNAAKNKTYGYNTVYRLTSGKQEGNTFNYTYDKVGNRTQDKRTNSAGVVTTTTHSLAATSNRLTSTKTGTTTTQYAYTAAGNRSKKTVGTKIENYTYNAANRLSEYTAANGTKTQYLYSPEGERIKKTTGTTVEYYVYGLSGELNTVLDANFKPKREYIYVNGTPIALITFAGTTPTVLYLHSDHLNTPQKATNQNQQVVWSSNTDPFGRPLSTPGTNDIFTRFPGQMWDAESGLHYNYFRDYDPAIGRYIQSDPIGLGDGVNTYAYVGGNPISNFDFYGLDTSDHKSGRWIECQRGCRIRIDFFVVNGKKIRHLHWVCPNGTKGVGGEFGESSHGENLGDAPAHIKECAKKNGFEPNKVNRDMLQCDNGCQAGLVLVGGVCVVAACILNPVLCGIAVGGGAASGAF